MAEREAAAVSWLRERLAKLRPEAAAVEHLPSVAVITDSAAALPPAWGLDLPDDGRLAIVPMPVMVGPDIFGEGADDVAASIGLALAAGQPVRTSRPSPGQFERAYRAAKADGFAGAVSIHLSGALSGTVESAQLAAATVDFPVEVIDTRTVGMAQGFGVQAALLAAAAGSDLREVAAAVRQQTDAARIYFYVPSLDQLRRGGRIGTAASWLGTVFSIKPILSVRDGQVVPLERIRTEVRAIARLEELVRQDIAGRPVGAAKLAVHHFGNEPAAEALCARLVSGLEQAAAAAGAEAAGGVIAGDPVGPAAGIPAVSAAGAAAKAPEVLITPLPAVLAAHAGLGVLAVIVGEDPAQRG
ncbi:DegV family protein [Paenarthrobacter sp. Z7-10]|uniref:DegV family protein n=1 Tax=Paenarthrobacter sp. Z7-10 TaxID=2787635 RepID=UPI0022A913E5|nr:DegV family protein [Paenarthrobacter sp. Z7-10]MCZ2402699.1 DegV family protein [Paenarthrobacter sp. Z7-10]